MIIVESLQLMNQKGLLTRLQSGKSHLNRRDACGQVALHKQSANNGSLVLMVVHGIPVTCCLLDAIAIDAAAARRLDGSDVGWIALIFQKMPMPVEMRELKRLVMASRDTERGLRQHVHAGHACLPFGPRTE